MLEAGDIQVVGFLIQIGAADLLHFELGATNWQPWVVLSLAILALLNYRGVFMTLTVNFWITFIAFLSIIVLFIGVKPWNPGEIPAAQGSAGPTCPMAGSACCGAPFRASGSISASKAPARRRKKCVRRAARCRSAPSPASSRC
jgi:amino acid transporter